ncbi:peptidoglycan-binding protein [Bradyrhizobium jicamae]|uniref:Peptidoglycan-binding protein n=1 Tax=Bradyrhizobium jicamae TaxID=280332 RepID=A0ABS5FKU3_9BRAD|nr:peptidoglycan-binding domain-containing protein [Bradyrhizobium jicamae]MBR0797403.1 peptidoglycan-binding protein [Bradyrhizobium jicamae]
MRTIAIALLTTSMLAAPAAFAAPNNQQQGRQQTQQSQQNAQDQQKNQQNAQDQHQQQQNGQQQSAQNEPIAPRSLSRHEVRRVQQALDKDGFKAGPTDGRWGNETRNAVKQFQQSKQIQATGQLDQQTVADLGLDASRLQQRHGQK